ncbi:CDP-glycerol glycerophosphotransferase family protein [Brevibacterium sp. CBA3109]|uniref:CDP-glycerol glycerophosphotransferase family protein n=1 Tax=Brevibacterium koreense TaxID=3140787 RepID=UPI00330580DA
MPVSTVGRGAVVGARSLVTGKPIAFVAPDLSQYGNETRGFYFDFVDDALGSIFSRTDDTTAWIKSNKNGNVDHVERYVSFLSRFAPMVDGVSAARFVNRYSGLIETPELEG